MAKTGRDEDREEDRKNRKGTKTERDEDGGGSWGAVFQNKKETA